MQHVHFNKISDVFVFTIFWFIDIRKNPGNRLTSVML